MIVSQLELSMVPLATGCPRTIDVKQPLNPLLANFRPTGLKPN